MRLDFAPRKEIKDSLGFWIPRHGFRIKQPKFSQVQGFNKQISPRIPLHWAKTALMLQALTAGMVSMLTLGRTCKLTPPPWYKGAGGGWSF